jgi:hypothetical protein
MMNQDPGDEDDGSMKRMVASFEAWIKARRAWARPMVAPDSSILYLTYRYSQTVYDHDGGDEDRCDIAPPRRRPGNAFQTRSNPPRPVR